MEFFVENWLWFLAGAIVIIMTLIGYIAEKTDFGRQDIPKREKPKKEKKKTKATEELTEVLETEVKPEVQMSLATDVVLEDENPISSETSEEVDMLFDINESVDVQPSENVDDAFTEPLYEETNEQSEVLQPIEEFNMNVVDNPENAYGSYEEPVTEIEEVVEDEPSENLNLNDINMLDVELPDLNSIVTETSQDDDSDDVWKF